MCDSFGLSCRVSVGNPVNLHAESEFCVDTPRRLRGKPILFARLASAQATEPAPKIRKALGIVVTVLRRKSCLRHSPRAMPLANLPAGCQMQGLAVQLCVVLTVAGRAARR